jgi:hypothetical protein
MGATPWPGFSGDPRNNLRVYEPPIKGRRYVIGGDVAMGNPNSDDSVACVIDRLTQRQVCVLAAKLEPGEYAHWVARLAEWYNNAPVLVERNHKAGSYCIKALLTVPPAVAKRPRLLVGRDNSYGWWTDYQGKRMMYDRLADAIRCGSCLITDQQTFDQLTSLDVEELNAPTDQLDDCSVAFAMAVYACSTPEKKLDENVVLTYSRDPKPAEPVEPMGPVAEGVDWVDVYGEWWSFVEVNGARVMLLGAAGGKAGRQEAERAARWARDLLAEPPAPRPSDDLGGRVWDKMRDKGIIT